MHQQTLFVVVVAPVLRGPGSSVFTKQIAQIPGNDRESITSRPTLILKNKRLLQEKRVAKVVTQRPADLGEAVASGHGLRLALLWR